MSNIKIEYDVFIWSSDFEDHRGEGILARLFLKKLSVKSSKTFFVKTPGSTYLVHKGNVNVLKKKIFNLNFFNKYIVLFYGIFLIWLNFFKKKKNNLSKLFTTVEFFNFYFFTQENNFRTYYRGKLFF